MIAVLQKRKQSFRNQCLKYSRYVLNDHFVLFLLIFLGFLAVQYSQFLRALPEDRSFLLVLLVFAPLLLVPVGSIATYLEKPDMIFLLVKEEELKEYLRIQTLRATMFWGVLQTVFLLLFLPLALAMGLSGLVVIFYLVFLFLLKALVFQWKGKRFYHQEGLNWTRMIEVENLRKQTILRFFALFTNVKGITNSVKRRAYLDGLTTLVPKVTSKTWNNLYLRSYLRNGDLFAMSLRLLGLSLAVFVFVPQSMVAVAIVALFNYLLVFQLLGLYNAFDYQYLTKLFPLETGTKTRGLLQTMQMLLLIVGGIEGVVGLFALEDKLLVLVLLAFTALLSHLYSPFKLRRLVDEML